MTLEITVGIEKNNIMELREFINETVTQIAQGVKDAQEATKGTGAMINPRMKGTDQAGKYVSLTTGAIFVSEVEINVAISALEKEGNKFGIGVVTGLLSGGGAQSSGQENSTMSTVKFCVPIALPIYRPQKNEG